MEEVRGNNVAMALFSACDDQSLIFVTRESKVLIQMEVFPDHPCPVFLRDLTLTATGIMRSIDLTVYIFELAHLSRVDY